MIQKTIKTTNGKLQVKIPSQLSELTLGQMIALQEKKDLSDLEAISILSGIPVTTLQQIANGDDLLEFADNIMALSRQISNLYNSDDIPKHITLKIGEDSVKVNVIRNLSVEPAGAFMAARDIIAEEIARHIDIYGQENWQDYFNPSLTACCDILAHYFYCRATSKAYDEYAIIDFTDTIKQLRVTEALPIAKHFFMRYPNLSKRKTPFWHRMSAFWKNGRVFKTLKNLNISTP
ncbi:hypothetical protein ACFQZX_04060 [Mucilaginibacter litoreus]|uniref:HTH cro/C1-type domain-containing protein n=1 Tax=Mucilaginibacter litoreus TaxID=1048221 RepID=A0ABW3AP23_9SPHI